MNFRRKVPDGGSPSFGEAMQAAGDADTKGLSERDSGGLWKGRGQQDRSYCVSETGLGAFHTQ